MKKKTPYLSSIFDGLSTMSIKFKPTFEKKIYWVNEVGEFWITINAKGPI